MGQTPPLFARWLALTGLTQEAAAARLGISKSQVANLAAGVNRSRGNPIEPDYRTRVLMRLIAEGRETEPWE